MKLGSERAPWLENTPREDVGFCRRSSRKSHLGTASTLVETELCLIFAGSMMAGVCVVVWCRKPNLTCYRALFQCYLPAPCLEPSTWQGKGLCLCIPFASKEKKALNKCVSECASSERKSIFSIQSLVGQDVQQQSVPSPPCMGLEPGELQEHRDFQVTSAHDRRVPPCIRGDL